MEANHVLSKEAHQARRQRVLLLLESARIIPFKRKASLFICIYCDQGYLDPAEFREHNLVHDKVKPRDMRKAVARVDLLKADITEASCRICNTPFDKLTDIVIHLIEKHNKKIDETADFGILPYKMMQDIYICAICDEKYTDYKTLNNHMNAHYRRFVCEQCGAGFVTAKRLKSHVITHSTGFFPCTTCNKVFSSRDAMNGHYAYMHLKIKKHSCPQCTETFSNYAQRLKHLSSAHGMKLEEFKCDLCPKVYNARGALGTHIRAAHVKERRHACDLCEAKFYAKSELTQHTLLHTGEKNYQCSVCQKTYGRYNHLRRHMATHL